MTSSSLASLASPENSSGILIVDKPYGWSSHDVVNIVRRATGIRRVGHAGTLDPLATGVLVVLVGREATRMQDMLMAGVKQYRAEIGFGVSSATEDIEGPLTEMATTGELRALTQQQITEVLPEFIGIIEQTPPAFSAIQVGGKRLYAEARKGVLDLALIPKRTVQIDAIEDLTFRPLSKETNDALLLEIIEEVNAIHSLDIPRKEKDVLREELTTKLRVVLPTLECTITCQKGTYIRSLARDIGAAVGTSGSLLSLERTRVGDYTLADAVSIEQVRDGAFTLLPLPSSSTESQALHAND